MTPRSGNVTQVSPLQKKAKITNSLSHRQLLILVSNLCYTRITKRPQGGVKN